MLATDYPFFDVFWTILIFFLWVMWFWLLFTCWADIFRRHDISGWGKAGWLIFTIVLPFLGVFVYLIAESKGIAERNMERAQQQRSQFDDYVREAASGGGPAAEIERAQTLLNSGAITQEEFDAIKRRALSSAT